MDLQNCKTEDQIFDDQLMVVDSVIKDASAAIDAGDFHGALNGFRRALTLARSLFGDNCELATLNDTIADINGMLSDTAATNDC